MQIKKHISSNQLYKQKNKVTGRKNKMKNKNNSVGMYSTKIVYSDLIKREQKVFKKEKK